MTIRDMKFTAFSLQMIYTTVYFLCRYQILTNRIGNYAQISKAELNPFSSIPHWVLIVALPGYALAACQNPRSDSIYSTCAAYFKASSAWFALVTHA